MNILVSQRGVVFFRRQDNLDDPKQKELVQRLGELSGKPSTSKLHIHPVYPDSPEAKAHSGNDEEISVISSVSKKKIHSEHAKKQAASGAINMKQSTRREWHSDIAFNMFQVTTLAYGSQKYQRLVEVCTSESYINFVRCTIVTHIIRHSLGFRLRDI